MKKKVFWVAAMVCCIGFSSMNVVKSEIKNLQFLMTVSSETLANAEAIDPGEGEDDGFWDKDKFTKEMTDSRTQIDFQDGGSRISLVTIQPKSNSFARIQ